MDEVTTSFEIPCIRVKQPIGDFYLASIDYRRLCDITAFDVRRMVKERDVETYLGIQRPLLDGRVKEIGEYVNTLDACFPSGVILAIDGNCAYFDEANSKLILSNYLEPSAFEDKVHYRQIAKVLDGQHRIAGLKAYNGDEPFEVNVSVFIDIDIEDQAYIFSTVNLAQTKVNKSIVYDLFELSKTRSPQKTSHIVAVGLDKHEKSPFFKRIKRLGVSTEGRFNEMLTQATFVQSIIPYISNNPLQDRDLYLRGRKPEISSNSNESIPILRKIFLAEDDIKIADIVWNYFDAVKLRWPVAWSSVDKGQMLARTNGFKGLMRFLKPAYLSLSKEDDIVSTDQFFSIFEKININDADLNTTNFPPGAAGELALYKMLITESKLDG